MAVVGAVTMGMGSLNFGLYIKPMGDELSIGRASFGWASSARSATGAITGPFIGRLLDRYGAKWILVSAAVITGLCMIGLKYTSSSWQLIIIFAVMGLVGMSGPGSLATSVPPTKWFVRNRGKALAYSSAGISAGAVVFVPLTQVFIDKYTWQESWVILAFIGMGIIVPLSLLFLVREPEDMGLLPDGEKTSKTLESGEEDIHISEIEKSWTTREAIRTFPMWTLTAAFSILSLGILTLALHRIPAFMDRGLDPSLVSLATAFDAVCAGAGSFTAGMLVRKIPAKIIGSSAFLMLAVASVMSIYAYDFWLMFWSMALFGLGIGTNMFNQNYIWAEYFGRTNLGSIRGIVMPINLFIGGLGAPAAGYVVDMTGSYDPAWWTGVALMLVAAALFVVSNNPGEPQTEQIAESPYNVGRISNSGSHDNQGGTL
ncbi:MFS transporter [Dehalococcoidia bacterium]|nr:MFS transporter [Dehalococcoidia bacterium]